MRAAGLQSAASASKLAGDQLAHARQTLGWSRIVAKKLLGEANGAQREADRFSDVPVLREGDFAASAAQIEQQHAPGRAGLAAGYAKMNQAAFFKAGDHFEAPSGFGLHPCLEGGGVARVAQGRGSHNADPVYAVRLHCALKTL